MTGYQKMAWTISFSAFYMIEGVRFVRWTTTTTYITPNGDSVQNLLMALLTPFIALLISAPGGYLIYKIWKET